MSLTVALRLLYQGKEAQAGVRSTATEVKGLTTATREAGAASTTAAGQQHQLTGALTETEAAARGTAAAQIAAAQTGRDMAQSNRLAAGSVGNLTANLNDVGMMIAAGQNPLMLAIQQGTQITQVIGPMGAAGAVGALKGAFLSLLSPVNLVTLGVIAFGAAAIQWLTSVSQEADKTAETYEKLAAATTAIQGKINQLRFGVDEDYQVELLQEQIRLRNEYNTKTGELNAYLATTTESIDLQRIKTADLVASIGQIVSAYERNDQLLASQENRAVQLAILEGVRTQRANETAAAIAAANQAAADQSSAEQIIADLTTEAQLNQLIAQYGQESYNVAAARANAERAVFAAMADSLNVSAALKAEMLRAYDAAKGIASVNIAAMIEAAVGRAAALANNLWNAARASSAIRPFANVAGNAASGVAGWASGVWSNMVTMASSGTGVGSGAGIGAGSAGGGGGGAAATEAESNAIEQLIERQQQELDLLRESDPVKKEMLRYRKDLATATDKERLIIEELIATRIREEQGIKARADAIAYANDMTYNFLNTVIVQGKSANAILQQLLGSMLQAFTTGKGPWASIFKISGGIFDTIFPKAALGPAALAGPVGMKALNGPSPKANTAPQKSGPGKMQVTVVVNGASGDNHIRALVTQGVRAGLSAYDTTVLPQSVRSANEDPQVMRK